jgi:hypothetical protein
MEVLVLELLLCFWSLYLPPPQHLMILVRHQY